MIVYFVAAACFIFYLAAVPLKVCVVFSGEDTRRLRLGAFPFAGRLALRRSRRRSGAGKGALPPAAVIRPALRAIRHLMAHAGLDYIGVQGIVSEPDAARTALVCGALSALRHACAAAGLPVDICVQPDFSGVGSNLEWTGMFSIRAGHIILAALIFAHVYLKERFKTWTQGIRSKTSCSPPWKASAT